VAEVSGPGSLRGNRSLLTLGFVVFRIGPSLVPSKRVLRSFCANSGGASGTVGAVAVVVGLGFP